MDSGSLYLGYNSNPNWDWTGDAPTYGYFNQSGGVHNTTQMIVGLGWLAGGTGVYNMSGGALNVIGQTHPGILLRGRAPGTYIWGEMLLAWCPPSPSARSIRPAAP